MVTVPGGPSRRAPSGEPETQVSACPIHCPTCSCGVRPTTTPSRCWRCSATTMGWRADEPNEAFFTWKHFESPFGRSPAWVAAEPETLRIVGFRTFMRWEFER